MQLEAVKGYIQNGLFYPTFGSVAKTTEPIEAVLTILGKPAETISQRENSENKSEEELEIIRQKRLAFLGSMDGKVWMANDFDDPLEEMKEYME